jgi:hypothetical protein
MPDSAVASKSLRSGKYLPHAVSSLALLLWWSIPWLRQCCNSTQLLGAGMSAVDLGFRGAQHVRPTHRVTRVWPINAIFWHVTIQKRFMITHSNFDLCWLITLVGTENKWRGDPDSYPADIKNGADYWCQLLKWADIKNWYLVPTTYVIRYYKWYLFLVLVA